MSSKRNSHNHIRAASLEVGSHGGPSWRRKAAGWLVKGGLVVFAVVGGIKACDTATDHTTNGHPTDGSSSESKPGLEPIAGCKVKIGKLGVYAALGDLDFPQKAELQGSVHVNNASTIPDQWEIKTPDDKPYSGDINNYTFPSGTYIEAGAPRNLLTPQVCQAAGGQTITVVQRYHS